MDTCVDFAELAAPFPLDAIEWRLQQAGEKNGRIWCRCVPYLTSRAVMDRLDLVAGPSNWRTELRESERGMLCGLSIRVDGEWITKWDGADYTDIEAYRGAISGSFKRAAVPWGIGRYLYNLEESFGEVSENGSFSGKTPDGKRFRWNPPRLPAWALPGGSGKAGSAERDELALAKQQRQEHEANLAFIRRVYDQLDPATQCPVHPDRPTQLVSLREYIRRTARAAKSDPPTAISLVSLIEEHTNHRVHPARAAA